MNVQSQIKNSIFIKIGLIEIQFWHFPKRTNPQQPQMDQIQTFLVGSK